MSNIRRPAVRNPYRADFLRSPVWFARRDRWFAEEQARGHEICCTACGLPANPRSLELHHLDYTGVTHQNGRWYAAEHHDDLMALHPACHETLHRIIEHDTVLARHRTRREATHLALTRARDLITDVSDG